MCFVCIARRGDEGPGLRAVLGEAGGRKSGCDTFANVCEGSRVGLWEKWRAMGTNAQRPRVTLTR